MMIEIEKMLHLRKYILTVLRADTKSRAVSSLRSTTTLSQKGGYVSRCLPLPLPLPLLKINYISTELRPHASYASCIRAFSTTIAQSSIDDIDQKLISLCDDAKNGRLSVEHLREVIKLCNDNDYRPHASTALSLLQCCGNLLGDETTIEKQELVDQVWHFASRSDNPPTLEHYNTLLRVYVANANSVDPDNFLASMGEVKPDENTYRLLLSIVARNGSIGHIRNIVNLMKKKDFILNENDFSTLLQVYVTNGNIQEAENVMTLMKDIIPSTDKLNTELACGYAILGDIPNLVKILNDEPQSSASLLRIVKALSISENGRHIPVVLNFLTPSLSGMKSEIMKTITELIRTNHAADAHTIISCFALNETTTKYANSFINCFLNELIMINTPFMDISKYASDYVDSGCEPLALNNLLEISLKLDRENLSLAIFEEMKKRNIEIRPHYYWPLLITAHRKQGETKIYSLVKSMVDMGVDLDFDTFINYVFPFVNNANPIIILKKLKINGIFGSSLYTPMVSFLLFQNRLEEVISLCEYRHMKLYYRHLMKPLVRAYFATGDVENCARLLTIFENGHDFIGLFLLMLLNNKQTRLSDIEILLKTFLQYRAKISQHDAFILKKKITNFSLINNENINLLNMIDNLVYNQKEDTAISIIPDFRHLNSKELECALVNCKAKELSTKKVLRCLLEVYCAEDNLTKVEKVKQEIDKKQFKWYSGMKMFLFELYIKHNKLKEAELLLSDFKEISQSTFAIDKDKILKFATALVKANKPKSAFDVITQFANLNDRKSMDNQCLILLNTLALSHWRDYTKDMLNLLINKNYCTTNIDVLRPLITIPLEKNDILTAVDTFVEIAQRYKKTPMSQELLTALLRQRSSLDNANIYIEKVYNLVVNLYGNEVANTLLVIGLATLDKTDELQTVLRNQTISKDSLIHYSNYATNTNKTDVLLKIFKAMPNEDMYILYHNVLCDLILFAYCVKSDCNNALILWELMCAKNMKPSKQFKYNFISFLSANKVPLPADFEMDKDEINVGN